MSEQEFKNLVSSITADIAQRPLDTALNTHLNDAFAAEGPVFRELANACRAGIAEGRLCNREHGGIKYGRIIEAGPDTQGFSVDVVEMEDIAGPHHRHPNGEIDMIIAETEGAKFDGHGEGWLVYAPDSAHRPTVTGGRAIILYLLPGGAIEFTRV